MYSHDQSIEEDLQESSRKTSLIGDYIGRAYGQIAEGLLLLPSVS